MFLRLFRFLLRDNVSFSLFAPNKFMDHFLSGAIGGLASCLILQPLDVIKTRQQESKSNSLRSLVRSMKLNQFWNGTKATILRNVPGSALYFFALDGTKTALTPLIEDRNLRNLISGSACRAAIGFVLMPMSVLKTRMESSAYKYNSILHASKSIVQKEGFKSLFAGWGATALRDAPYAGIYVVSYENCKRFLDGAYC